MKNHSASTTRGKIYNKGSFLVEYQHTIYEWIWSSYYHEFTVFSLLLPLVLRRDKGSHAWKIRLPVKNQLKHSLLTVNRKSSISKWLSNGDKGKLYLHYEEQHYHYHTNWNLGKESSWTSPIKCNLLNSKTHNTAIKCTSGI